MSQQVVTVTFFRYRGVQRLWSFAQMGLAPRHLRAIDGLSFFKLLGTGAGAGFSLRPDFSAYALLGAWVDEAPARAFLRGDPPMDRLCAHSHEHWTVVMRSLRSKGSWNGRTPFEPGSEHDPEGPRAVITRASLRRRSAPAFWRAVPGVSAPLRDTPGLLFAKGIGEIPWIEQATFSVWRDTTAIRAYAYEHPAHRRAIEETARRGWYSEDLFARFEPIASEGSWLGADPLAGML
jgi:hypothetical protein